MLPTRTRYDGVVRNYKKLFSDVRRYEGGGKCSKTINRFILRRLHRMNVEIPKKKLHECETQGTYRNSRNALLKNHLYAHTFGVWIQLDHVRPFSHWPSYLMWHTSHWDTTMPDKGIELHIWGYGLKKIMMEKLRLRNTSVELCENT